MTNWLEGSLEATNNQGGIKILLLTYYKVVFNMLFLTDDEITCKVVSYSLFRTD